MGAPRGIVLHARKTSDPWGTGGVPVRETIAREESIGEGSRSARVCAVVGMDRVVFVRVPASRLRVLAELAAELELPLLDVGAWGDHACASIPLLNVPDWSRQSARLEAALEGSAKLDEGGRDGQRRGGRPHGERRFATAISRCGRRGLARPRCRGPLADERSRTFRTA